MATECNEVTQTISHISMDLISSFSMTVSVCHLRKLQIATGVDALNNKFITAQLIAQEVFTALSPEVEYVYLTEKSTKAERF